MTAKIIDGKAFAAHIREQVAERVATIKSEGGKTPGLAVILVGDDPASEVYVASKKRQTTEVGMNSFEHRLPASTTREELLSLIDDLNNDPAVHGILCQLPLPEHLDEHEVINAIDVAKDVDGFHIENVGKLATGQDSLVPCTPLGSLLLLRQELGDLSGKHAVVIGRSNIVGKPMAQLLLRDSATVTIVHSKTQNIENIVKEADIVIAAVGRPHMVKADWIKSGAAVIDVGINRIGTAENGRARLAGDVDFENVKTVAGLVTPVPGGVGPMTIGCLLANTLTAFCRIEGLPVSSALTA